MAVPDLSLQGSNWSPGLVPAEAELPRRYQALPSDLHVLSGMNTNDWCKVRCCYLLGHSLGQACSACLWLQGPATWGALGKAASSTGFLLQAHE